jgi:hypothetical protein
MEPTEYGDMMSRFCFITERVFAVLSSTLDPEDLVQYLNNNFPQHLIINLDHDDEIAKVSEQVEFYPFDNFQGNKKSESFCSCKLCDINWFRLH